MTFKAILPGATIPEVKKVIAPGTEEDATSSEWDLSIKIPIIFVLRVYVLFTNLFIRKMFMITSHSKSSAIMTPQTPRNKPTLAKSL